MPISTVDLLEPASWLGQRADRFRFDLLDENLATIGELNPADDARPGIRANSESTVMRQISGLEFVQGELDHIDVRKDRIRPVCVLQNGAEFELGVFMFGEHNTQITTRGNVWLPVMYDQALILDQPIDRTISVQPGDDLQYLFNLIALEVGVPEVLQDVGGMPASEPIAWPAGRSRFQVEADIAQRMGCLRPHFNNHGQLVCKRAPDPTTALVPDGAYGAGRIVADTIIDTDDSYRAPNRYICIGSGSSAPVVGIYDLPPSAPHSAANRGGLIVAETVDAAGITDQAAAVDAARAAALQDSRSWQRSSFTSPLDPRLDLFSVIEYFGAPYLETGFTQQLSSGGDHTHEVSRLWV